LLCLFKTKLARWLLDLINAYKLILKLNKKMDELIKTNIDQESSWRSNCKNCYVESWCTKYRRENSLIIHGTRSHVSYRDRNWKSGENRLPLLVGGCGINARYIRWV